MRTSAAVILVLGAVLLAAPTVDAQDIGVGSRAQVDLNVNRPTTPFDCDTPRGEAWYGSTERCLDEMCAGQNVFNEYIFDSANRRRRNPCYGRSPTEFGR